MCFSQLPSSHCFSSAVTGGSERPLIDGLMPVAWKSAALRRRLSMPETWAFWTMLRTSSRMFAPVIGLSVMTTSTTVVLVSELTCKKDSLTGLCAGPGLKVTNTFTCSSSGSTIAASVAATAAAAIGGGAGAGAGAMATKAAPTSVERVAFPISGMDEPSRGIDEPTNGAVLLKFLRPSIIVFSNTLVIVSATVSPKVSPVCRKDSGSLASPASSLLTSSLSFSRS
mmetsp:Transcript_31350/g.90013  ORF Transcript_31350/g.90013 Transcript_31350/m.90013 type:complete len:226 (+) Transcript_31350:446-1123(+)